VDDLNDKAGYAELEAALGRIGIVPVQQRAVFKVLAGVLHLGNINFRTADSEGFASRLRDASPRGPAPPMTPGSPKYNGARRGSNTSQGTTGSAGSFNFDKTPEKGPAAATATTPSRRFSLGGILKRGAKTPLSVHFGGGGDQAKVANKGSLEYAASLLGIKAHELESALVKGCVIAQGRALNPARTGMGIDTAEGMRDLVAKVIYGRLLAFLLDKINIRVAEAISQADLNKSPAEVANITVLDLVGFEPYKWGEFEQLCRNYMNE
ncbi:unnamed protein product, partial [Chrysoparadoxa australica]